jgi:AraC-like DNA-binding protein
MEFISPVSMQSDYIPPRFEALRIPMAEVFTHSKPGLTVVSQKIALGNYDVFFHIFDAEDKVLIRPRSREDILTIHYMLKGNIDAVLRRGRRVELKTKEYNMFQLPGHSHYAIIDKGVYWCFHINIHQNVQQELHHLFMFEFFQRSLRETGGIINLRPYRIDARENILIKKVLDYKEHGPAAAEGLKPIIDELLLEFADKYSMELDAYFSGTKVSDMQLANMLALKSYLTSNLGQSHDMAAIAKQFLIAPKILEDTFFYIFGQHFSDYYTNQRLSRVFSMLSNPTLTIENIALFMGYGSQNSLRIAFEDFFGRSIDEVKLMLDNGGDPN